MLQIISKERHYPLMRDVEIAFTKALNGNNNEFIPQQYHNGVDFPPSISLHRFLIGNILKLLCQHGLQNLERFF